jgi:hypothetical protein
MGINFFNRKKNLRMSYKTVGYPGDCLPPKNAIEWDSSIPKCIALREHMKLYSDPIVDIVN